MHLEGGADAKLWNPTGQERGGQERERSREGRNDSIAPVRVLCVNARYETGQIDMSPYKTAGYKHARLYTDLTCASRD